MDWTETHSIGAQTRERIVAPSACAPFFEQRRICLAGMSDALDGFRFVRLKPTISQALVCTGGEGRVWVDGRWRRCGEGDAYLTPPGKMHAYHARPRSRWKLCWVSYLHPAGEMPVIAAPEPVLARVNPRPLKAALEGLYQECGGPAEPALMEHWAELVDLLVRRMTRPWTPDDRLWRLWERVDSELSRPWTLDGLARLACMSNEHLRRLTRRLHGHSPLEHVTHLRMRRAAALLASSPQKVETIARAVGYRNAFAFTAAFRRRMGRSPSEFRLGAATPRG